ncbi:Uncharacterised protein [[Eubacterium] siraeum]|uniref:Uncharacterized protein n=1 Tax=[Eubacterium] siraeum TaxID=39492 RepID=A0A174YZ93_9FIRM|nr:Uncharacterised protein [[Eubacterium] siraeum]
MNKIAVTVASDMAENFNPRPRKEGDYITDYDDIKNGVISIHALAKRATTAQIETKDRQIISIHALVKRATVDYNIKCNTKNMDIILTFV